MNEPVHPDSERPRGRSSLSPRKRGSRRAPRKEREPRQDLSRPPELSVHRVGAASEGQRLDVFLAEVLPGRSRDRIQEIVALGRVSVEGRGAVRNALRLREGEHVTVRDAPPSEPVRHAEIPLRIIWEDADLVAIDKQAGLQCHPAGTLRFNTLINVLHYHYLVRGGASVPPALCHRLDRETSGVLLVAKQDDARRDVQEQFEARTVRKTYLALVAGHVERDREEIAYPLIQAPSPLLRTMIHARADGLGAPSRTVCEVVRRLPGATLVRCHLYTGRQHQIRVHLAAIGHALLGDPLYGDADAIERAPREPDRERKGGGAGEPRAPRLMLHAESLSLLHPRTREPLRLVAPVPEDVQAMIDALLREAGR